MALCAENLPVTGALTKVGNASLLYIPWRHNELYRYVTPTLDEQHCHSAFIHRFLFRKYSHYFASLFLVVFVIASRSFICILVLLPAFKVTLPELRRSCDCSSVSKYPCNKYPWRIWITSTCEEINKQNTTNSELSDVLCVLNHGVGATPVESQRWTSPYVLITARHQHQ